MAKVLKLVFNIADSTKSLTVTVKNPKNDLTGETVTNAMNDIIAKDFFKVNGASLDNAKAAYYEETTKTILA